MLKIVAYKHNQYGDNIIIYEGSHNALYSAGTETGYKKLTNLSVPMSSLVAKWGFIPVKQPIRIKNSQEIKNLRVDENGVTI